jgi:hypothetical protein
MAHSGSQLAPRDTSAMRHEADLSPQLANKTPVMKCDTVGEMALRAYGDG